MNSSRTTVVVAAIGLPLLAIIVWVAWPQPPLNGLTGDLMVVLGALAMVVVIVFALTEMNEIRPHWLPSPGPYPLLGVLIAGIVLTVIGWASIYQHAAVTHAVGNNACFALTTNLHGRVHPPHVGHWGSLYYTMGMLTTAGTGVLGAESSTCQALSTLQLIENLLLVATTVSLAGTWFSRAMGARREQRRKRRADHPHTERDD
jgi:hypothetical protein